MTQLIEEMHKWPHGFKKKLAEHYGFKVLRCALCWSNVRVAIHHYAPHNVGVLTHHVDGDFGNFKIDWNVKKFVPLCASCHGKFEAIQSMYMRNVREKIPFYKLLHHVVEEANTKDSPAS
jgi:hypothetical protein